MCRWRVVSALIFSLLPLSAWAVEITEVAWMGNEASHYCEWIELYNNSAEALDLSAWQLQVGDSKTALDSSETSDLTIPPQSYRLIERTTASCPDPVAGEAGIALSFGGLPNSGATISLLNGDGEVATSVVGGEDWQQIGGDNESKETAQSSEEGWLTAPATPGEPTAGVSNTSSDEEAATEEGGNTDETTGNDSIGSSQEAVELELPAGELSLTIAGPERVYKNQPVKFSTTPSGVVEGIKPSLVYRWNFGDTNTQSGREVEHIYKRAGTYVVTVYSAYARHEALVTKTVTVVPSQLELSRAQNGDFLIHNPATYAMNISGYELQGQSSLVFPDHSYIASKQTLTIPRSQVENGAFSYTAIFDATGLFVASTKEETGVVDRQPEEEISTSTPPVPEREAKSTPQVLGLATGTQAVEGTNDSPDSEDSPGDSWWLEYWEYLALLALLAIAAYIFIAPSAATAREDGGFFS